MHRQCSHARSAVTGPPGQRIIRAMVAGERPPRPLAAFRHSRGQKAAAAMARARTGTWRAAPRGVRPQALALFDCDTAPWSACDAHRARACSVIPPPFAPMPAKPVAPRAQAARACRKHPGAPPPDSRRGSGGGAWPQRLAGPAPEGRARHGPEEMAG
jgi:hypothetical protein